MLVAAIFHFALPSPGTPRFLLSFPLLNPRGPSGGIRHTILLVLLHTISTLLPSDTFSLGTASSALLNSSFFQGFSSTVCTSLSHCQCFAHFFPFRFTTVQQPRILFFIYQDLRPSPPCCRLGNFVHETGTSLHTLDHLRHLVLVHLLHLFLLVLLFHLLQPLIPFLHSVFHPL